MRKYIVKNKFEFLLVLIGTLLLLFYYFAFEIYNQHLIYPDTESYISAADSLYFHARGHNLRPLVLAAIHGFPFLFTSTKQELIQFNILTNYFCFILSGILLYKILSSYLNNKLAFWISCIHFLALGIISNVFHMLSETIFIFFILLSFYFLNQYQIKKKYSFLILFLSMLSLSMLIRPGIQILALFFIFLFRKEIYFNLKNNWNFTLMLCWSIICIQMAGIKYQFGNFTISYVDAITYYSYLGSKAELLKNNTPYNQLDNPRTLYIYSLDYPDQKKIATLDLKEQIQNNTFNLIKAYIDDIYHNTIDESMAIKDLNNNKSSLYLIGIWISRFQNIFFTIIGVCLSLYYLFINNTRNKLISISGIYILYIVMTSGMSCAQGDRFHIVFYPISLLLIAFYLKKKKVIS